MNRGMLEQLKDCLLQSNINFEIVKNASSSGTDGIDHFKS
jgi:hypothetical protein